jgi:hypothetical protein
VAEIPHAQVVEQSAPIVQRPHYHEIDQYQVVIAGSGRIGNVKVGPGYFHYTDRATTYGPIVADPDGIHYVVLRPRGDVGVDVEARYMPEARQRRSRRPGRHRFGSSEAVMTGRVGNVWQQSLDNGDGGLVEATCLAADMVMPEPVGRSDCGPGYLVALRGSLVVGGIELVAPSVLWLEETDEWPEILTRVDAAAAAWFSFSRAHRAVVSSAPTPHKMPIVDTCSRHHLRTQSSLQPSPRMR